jgi:hypothetical protein
MRSCWNHEPSLERGGDRVVHRDLARARHHRERADVEPISDRRCERDDALGLRGQLAEVVREEVRHVVGDGGARDRPEIELERGGRGVESNVAVAVQRSEELPHEERIAFGLLPDRGPELSQRSDVAMERIGDEARGVRRRQRSERHREGARLLRVLLDREAERMHRRDLAVSIRLDQEQRLGLLRCREVREHVQARRVRPLHVVEEHDERVRRSREHLNEPLERPREALLRRCRIERHDRWLRPDHEIDRGDHLGEHASVRVNRGFDAPAPFGERGFALGEELLDEVAEREEHRAARHVAPELIELARHEEAAAPGHRLVDRTDHRRLADAGRSRDEHGLDSTRGRAIEGVTEKEHLRVAAVEALGQLESIRHVARRERDFTDTATRRELPRALAQIDGEAGRGLIAHLGRLREELRDHVGDRRGQRRVELSRRNGLDREVAVDDLERVGAPKGQLTGEEFVERHPERVEIGADVDAAVHAAGLLGRHVKQRSFERARRGEAVALESHPGRDVEVDELRDPRVAVVDDVRRVHVLVDDACAMNHIERARELHRDVERFRGIEAPLVEVRSERAATEVFEHEERCVSVSPDLVRANDPATRDRAEHLELVPVAGERFGREHLPRGPLQHHGGAVVEPARERHRGPPARVDLIPDFVARQAALHGFLASRALTAPRDRGSIGGAPAFV